MKLNYESPTYYRLTERSAFSFNVRFIITKSLQWIKLPCELYDSP